MEEPSIKSVPADIEVSDSQEGPQRERRYRLPKRTMPGVGCTIFFGALTAAIFGGIPLGFSILAGTFAAGAPWQFRLAAIAMPLVMFGVFLFPIAIYILLRVIFVHLGRLELVVERERLLIAQRWGFLSWTRRLRLQGLRGLRVITDRPFNPQDPQFSQDLSKIGTLLADYASGAQRTLCWGYPAEWLEQFGAALTDEISRQPGISQPLLPVTREQADPAAISLRRNQPSNSTAVVRQDGDRLTIDFPSPRWWNSINPVLLLFAFVWNGLLLMFTVLFTLAALYGTIQSEDPAEQAPIWMLVLFLIPFYLIGGGILVYWIGMCRRYSQIVLADSHLRITDHKLWQTVSAEWPYDQICSISALVRKQQNEQQVKYYHKLVLETYDGTTMFLEWRPKSEVEWLATTLQLAVGLPTEEEEPPESAN